MVLQLGRQKGLKNLIIVLEVLLPAGEKLQLDSILKDFFSFSCPENCLCPSLSLSPSLMKCI